MKLHFLPENLKNLGFTMTLGGLGYPKHNYFLFGHLMDNTCLLTHISLAPFCGTKTSSADPGSLLFAYRIFY